MSCFLKRTWAEIDLNKLSGNFKAIRAHVKPGCKIMAVVKADAYGHGVQFAAKEFDKAGADYFAVSNIEEAVQLRSFGIDKPILILGFTPPECAGELIRNRITQAVFSLEYARKLSDAAVREGGRVTVHIKIDTGMGRIGFLFHSGVRHDESVAEILEAARLKGLVPEGIFTHFSVSDEPENRFTRNQFAMFGEAVETLRKNGLSFRIRHCCNSAGLLFFPEMQLDMVRPGIILYGLKPDASLKLPIRLEPAMSLKTVMSQIKTLDKGVPLSYGMKYTTQKKTVVATLPIGYADGFIRSLSNSAEVLVNGKRAPIIGRVCMDQCLADVTGIPHPETCSSVTVIGRDGDEEITMDELAGKAGTINYEIACLIGKRVPRVYFRDGKTVGVADGLLPPPVPTP